MNWGQYNKNLQKRGSISFWIDEKISEWWYSKEKKGKGHPEVYSDKTIETCLKLRAIFRLPLRQTQGFVESIFARAGLDLKVPCYTQISRRSENLEFLPPQFQAYKQYNIAVDSTGLKIYGEGEWKVRQHGFSKRRTWRKVHLAVDVDTHIIFAHELTKNNVADGQTWNKIAPFFQDKIKNFYGDGAYDQTECYENIRKIGGNPVIPPRRDAQMQKGFLNPAKIVRDNAIAKIRMLGDDENARKQWKVENNYHQRSISETAMFRLKNTFGLTLKSRKFENQKTEIAVKINMLNAIADLGMPKNM